MTRSRARPPATANQRVPASRRFLAGWRSAASDRPSAGRSSGLAINVLVRGALTAISLVVVFLPAVVAIGAFAPRIPTIGRFGMLVITDLPYILNATAGALLLAVLSLRLGGGRFTRALVCLNSVVVLGLLWIVLWMSAFATQHGVAFSLIRQAVAAPAPPTADERVVFATLEGRDLHVDIWRARAATAGPAPAIVWIHGGAFISGVLGSRANLFGELAAAGIAVVDVEYRLASPPRWVDAPADVLCSLGWLRTNASHFGIDPAKVVVAGESAGGSLALLAAYGAGTDRLQSSCGGTPTSPAGVFVVAPAADLVGIWSDRSIYALGRPFPEAYIGGTPIEYPERYDQASPFRLLRGDLPPTFLLAGANDQFVRQERVTSLHDGILEAGSASSMVVAPFAGHGFDGAPNGYGAQLVEVLLTRFVASVTG